MNDQIQYGLNFAPSHEQAFEAWKQQPGARQILRQCYRFAARYGRRYRRTGRQVSMRLIWELTRDHVQAVRERCKRRGIALKQWDGYTLPNCHAPYVARHIEARRPEWRGMFRKSSLGHERGNKRVTVIEQRTAKSA